MEKAAQDGAEGAQGGQRVGYVYRDGRLRREVLPPEALPAPAVGAGPGLQTDVPLPQNVSWEEARRNRCCCCADMIPALAHAPYCPQYVEPVRVLTGCAPCDTTQEAHFHPGHILYQSGRELF